MADIIVTDVTPRVQYTAGAGSPTVFSYAFPIFADTDLNVYLTPVGVDPDDVTQILVYNVDYTVTNSVPPTVGGTITLTVGATAGDVITIVRNQPDNRLNNYIAGGLFEATDVNTDFDRTVLMSQQNKMYDQAIGVHYNVCAQPVVIEDTVLPVLGPNESWVKNNAGTAIVAIDITGGGGSIVNSVSGTANRITVVPTTGDVVVNIAATYVGQTSITTLGIISTGTWSATTIGTIYGGTGLTSYALGDIIYGSGVNTLAKLSGNTTAAIQYLAQTGTGIVSAAPVWTTISGGDITGAALTKVDDTNVTLTLGGTPATALLRAASLTLGWTGQLSLTRGGTNASLTADNGGIVYSSATALAILASTATAGKVLQSGSSAAPSWSTPTYPSASGTAGKILRSDGTNNVYSTSTFADTYTASNLLYSNGTNTVTGLATANSASLVTNSTGVPVWSSTMTDGQVIIGSTGATPVAASLTAGSGVTITPGAGSITISATGSGGTVTAVTASSPLASSGGNTPDISLSGVVDLAHGGTNANLTASNGGIFYSTATAGAILSGTATARQMLQSGASTTPAWSTTTWPATTTANQILYSSATSVIGEITTANSAVLRTDASGVPGFSASMTDGQLIIGDTSGTPVAASLTAGTNVTITNGAGTITISASGGAATVQAWANFVTGSTTLNKGFNVSSITNNATGDATVNFTSSMADANYAVVCGLIQPTATTSRGLCAVKNGTTPGTGSVNIITGGDTGALVNTTAYIAIFD